MASATHAAATHASATRLERPVPGSAPPPPAVTASHPIPRAQRVAVIGGGITGLVAARRLAAAGCRVELFEAGPQLGGQIRTVDFAGFRVDVGAEALHVASPPVATLLDELGLADTVVPARAGTTWIWSPRRLRRLPAGVGPAGPTRLGPVLRAHVLSPLGMARAGLEPLLPRVRVDGDIGVGELLARRFGPQVRDRLVEPVLGTLHAGAVDNLSLKAATPQLAHLVAANRSIVLAHRDRRSGPPPTFVTLPGGLQTLVDTLAESGGFTHHTRTPVHHITRGGSGPDHEPDSRGSSGPSYTLHLSDGAHPEFDGIVLAVPAAAAIGLLDHMAPDAHSALNAMRSVSVATVLLAYTGADIASLGFTGNGILLPAGSGRTLKAATFLSRKWPHLDTGELALVRLSAGRAGAAPLPDDDDELVDLLARDLHQLVRAPAEPRLARVVRWPGAMPQLQVGHLDLLQRLQSATAHLPNLVITGASLHGVGIGSCVAAGQRAAQSLIDHPSTREAVG